MPVAHGREARKTQSREPRTVARRFHKWECLEYGTPMNGNMTLNSPESHATRCPPSYPEGSRCGLDRLLRHTHPCD
jgi:hypothetical protein